LLTIFLRDQIVSLSLPPMRHEAGLSIDSDTRALNSMYQPCTGYGVVVPYTAWSTLYCSARFLAMVIGPAGTFPKITALQLHIHYYIERVVVHESSLLWYRYMYMLVVVECLHTTSVHIA
jgi:hypothetical protein